MSSQVYQQALTLVLAHEGGWSNNPKDPGGATMKGVIQTVYDHFRDNKGLARQTVRNIGDDELTEIYRSQYWDACTCDRLPAGLDYAVFDYAVNSGPERAIKDLQRVVGAGVDGQIGEQTVALVCRQNDIDALIGSLCDRRLAFLKSLRTWSTFGKGWERRVEGDSYGSQDGDDGVVDLAVKIHDAFNAGSPALTQTALDTTVKAPTAIGDKAGEIAGKGVPSDVAVTKTPQGRGVIATATGIGATALTTIGNLASQGQQVGNVAGQASDAAQKVASSAVTIHASAHKLFGIFDKLTLEVLTAGSLLLSLAGCGFFGWYYLQSQREKAIK